jgi:hypothetical protein
MSFVFSPNRFQEFREISLCVTKGTFQRVAIYLIVKREDNDTAVRMLHFHVTALAMHFDEAQSIQGCEDLLG